MRFAKGHGTGNDFVIVPDVDGALDLTPARVAALCDRRTGIGGDGLLRVVRSAKHPDSAGQVADAEWFMDYFNADGSYAEMCGNGVRVFVQYLLEEGLAEGPEVPVATRAGVRRSIKDGEEVRVDMGVPKLLGPSTATHAGVAYQGIGVDMGNPHLVCAVDDLDALDLETAPGFDTGLFPAGVNVEFTQGVRMRVYERGVGETNSCGTGACAVAVVALKGALGSTPVDVPGGRLTVTLDGETCWLAGPAEIVARGETKL
ncbi:diaminopimelate epimerase [Longispora albida]|uniref:diaminopimelate epimerase n=1 Tax=Longispora albida TaxID=203523 RepID=UPI00037DD849|nr:diaminopimelate epimerase [Longispora albida]